MVINIQDGILKVHAMGPLDQTKLQSDESCGTNDAYSSSGRKYEHNEEVKPELIRGANAGVIKTRAWKAMKQ